MLKAGVIIAVDPKMSVRGELLENPRTESYLLFWPHGTEWNELSEV